MEIALNESPTIKRQLSINWNLPEKAVNTDVLLLAGCLLSLTCVQDAVCVRVSAAIANVFGGNCSLNAGSL